MIIPVFNSQIAVYQFDQMELYGPGTPFASKVDDYFNDEIFANRTSAESEGKAISSVGYNNIRPFKKALELDTNTLGKWIDDTIMQGAHDLGLNPQEPFTLTRNWGNRMYQQASVRCHAHLLPGCHIVGVFYYEAPPQSADLVFVNDRTQNVELSHYPESSRFRVTPRPGMLVCHSPWLAHGTDAHSSDQVRTCFIYEGTFLNMAIRTLREPQF